MTDDLGTLRPEVREAVEYMDRGGVARIAAGGWRIIRAELLRLAEDAAMFAHAVSLGQRYKQRAEAAEAELAEARENETVALGLWNAAEGRATKAEAELAALKARIADAPIATLMLTSGAGDLTLVWAENPDEWAGKTVRLIVEE